MSSNIFIFILCLQVCLFHQIKVNSLLLNGDDEVFHNNATHYERKSGENSNWESTISIIQQTPSIFKVRDKDYDEEYKKLENYTNISFTTDNITERDTRKLKDLTDKKGINRSNYLKGSQIDKVLKKGFSAENKNVKAVLHIPIKNQVFEQAIKVNNNDLNIEKGKKVEKRDAEDEEFSFINPSSFMKHFKNVPEHFTDIPSSVGDEVKDNTFTMAPENFGDFLKNLTEMFTKLNSSFGEEVKDDTFTMAPETFGDFFKNLTEIFTKINSSFDEEVKDNTFTTSPETFGDFLKNLTQIFTKINSSLDDELKDNTYTMARENFGDFFKNPTEIFKKGNEFVSGHAKKAELSVTEDPGSFKDILKNLTESFGKGDENKNKDGELFAGDSSAFKEFLNNIAEIFEIKNALEEDIENMTVEESLKSFEEILQALWKESKAFFKQLPGSSTPLISKIEIDEYPTEGDLTPEDMYPEIYSRPTDRKSYEQLTGKMGDFIRKEMQMIENEIYDGKKITHGYERNKASAISNDEFYDKVHQEIIRHSKSSRITLKVKTLHITFEASLDVLKSGIFAQNSQIVIHDLNETKKAYSDFMKDLNVYEGTLKNRKHSYVCGYVVNNVFVGTIIEENGALWFVEPHKKHSSVKETVLYAVPSMSPDCSGESCRKEDLFESHSCIKEGEMISCFEKQNRQEKNVHSAGEPFISNKKVKRNNNEDDIDDDDNDNDDDDEDEGKVDDEVKVDDTDNVGDETTVEGEMTHLSLKSSSPQPKMKITTKPSKMKITTKPPKMKITTKPPKMKMATTTPKITTPARKLITTSIHNTSCSIELVSGPSHFVDKYNKNVVLALRELLIFILQANQILSDLDFDNDGNPDHLKLIIGHVALYGSHKDLIGKSMDQQMEILQKRPQNFCLSIAFSDKVPIPEKPVSIAYSGGVCKRGQPAQNVAVINTASTSRKSLFSKSWRVTEAIGQMMGSWATDCEHGHSMQGDRFNVFSECEVQNMKETLNNQGSCLEALQYRQALAVSYRKESTCGNGIVDEGEECDCGTKCKHSCCIPPGKKNECLYDRSYGHECEWYEPCCTQTCKIIPKSWRMYCGEGDPGCESEDNYCDGKSSTCLGLKKDPKKFNGKRCGPGKVLQIGAGTCQNGFCNSTVCQDAGLKDCRCEHSRTHACRICCQKHGSHHQLCQPAEYFGLKSNVSNYFLRYAGFSCSTSQNEHCDRFGVCSSKLSSGSQVRFFCSLFYGRKMAAVVLSSFTILWRIFSLRLF
ncbi:disintegrin domain-containing protein [Caerostris darwini]|uniref:Disintegrin domain-containing protein n=1 Tax=Caerostris darwini TaxID=1538125 RepID=A0AAV4RAG8_9ARAC|nr:disintegrin domain-containing protein [Caerostris darwini]